MTDEVEEKRVYVAPSSNMKPFDVSRPMEWPRWIKLLNFNFTAMHITEDKLKRAHFFTICGEQLYNLSCNLLHPVEVDEVEFSAIIKKLTEHFRPQVNEVAAYHRFHHCVQKSGQSTSEFVAELRRLATDCGFGNLLDNMIRNQLICGMRDGNVRTRLLQKADLTLLDAIETASRAETALKHVREMTEADSTAQSAVNWSSDATPAHSSSFQQTSSTTAKQHLLTQSGAELPSVPQTNIVCYRCAGDHRVANCQMDVDSLFCTSCEKKGHVAKICQASRRKNNKGKHFKKSKQNSKESNVYSLTGDEQTVQESLHQVQRPNSTRLVDTPAEHSGQVNSPGPPSGHYLFNVTGPEGHSPKSSSEAIVIRVKADGKSLAMEIDSGAAMSVIHEEIFFKLWPRNTILTPAPEIGLQDFGGNRMLILGVKKVRVLFRNRMAHLPLVVVSGCVEHSLLGRNWFSALGICVRGLHAVKMSSEQRSLEEPFHPALQVDTADLGEFKGRPVHLEIDASTPPVYLRARKLPYALLPQVEKELQRLQDLGVLKPVRYSNWATPVVVVQKRDGSIRLCGDYKSTVNIALKPDKYPLPSLDDLFIKLSGATVFSKLDLDQAFTQLRVDDESAQKLTINTHKGLFTVHRMPFGISAAPGIFQRLAESLLAGITGVAIYMDDIVVSGRSRKEHDARLVEVLDMFLKYGMKLKRSKCELFSSEVEFLGFRVSGDGIRPLEDKVAAVKNAPSPKCKAELQALLGLINYYDRFLHRRATTFEPLYRLLDDSADWSWEKSHEDALQSIKDLLSSSTVLTHYDGVRPLVMACDASPYGIAAVLSHITDEGFEAPIAFASRTLSSAERNYAQIDKEALSFVFGVGKFHRFIYGRSDVVFITDHKPLLGIFKQGATTPEHLSPRMLRWSLILSAYDYRFVFRPGKFHNNADALSRLPVQNEPQTEFPEPLGVHLLEMRDGPVNHAEISAATEKSLTLMEVMRFTRTGWPRKVSEDLEPYWRCRGEISIQRGCLLSGSRVVVPEPLRRRVLDSIHSSHHGIVRTKSAARGLVWWPGINEDIEATVRDCQRCRELQRTPPAAPPVSWPTAVQSWQRVHIDYLGPIEGHTFLIVVDAFSRYPIIKEVSSMSSATLIRHMRDIFADFGPPECLVSDNGTQLVSQEFRLFLHKNGVQLLNTPPYHPASNGLVERAVRSFKESFAKIGGTDVPTRLARTVFAMRTSQCATTGRTPAQMFFHNLQVRTPLDVVRPSSWAKKSLRERDTAHKFEINQPVFFRDYRRFKPKWSQGTITEQKGVRVYGVLDHAGIVHHRSVDQILADKRRTCILTPRISNSVAETPHVTPNDAYIEDFDHPSAKATEEHQNMPVIVPNAAPDRIEIAQQQQELENVRVEPNPEHDNQGRGGNELELPSSSRPQRSRKPPARYADESWGK